MPCDEPEEAINFSSLRTEIGWRVFRDTLKNQGAPHGKATWIMQDMRPRVERVPAADVALYADMSADEVRSELRRVINDIFSAFLAEMVLLEAQLYAELQRD